MARRDLIVRLEDIRTRIAIIENLVQEIKSLDALHANELYKLAMERAFEIIGEALYQVQKDAPTVIVTNISKIVSLRHLLAHDYFKVRHELLWAFATEKIPELKKEIITLIDKENMRLFGTNSPNLE